MGKSVVMDGDQKLMFPQDCKKLQNCLLRAFSAWAVPSSEHSIECAEIESAINWHDEVTYCM